MNIISEKELKNRVETLRKIVKDRNLNGIIVYSDEYRSGTAPTLQGINQ